VPIMVDTGDIPAHNHIQLCPEFAAVAGPFTLQAEYAAEWLNDVTAANPGQNTAFFHGGYCEALYFLTGEHQAYDFDTASFTRVVPRHNLRIRNGHGEACGAWQAGLRFSYLDLNDRSIRGGEVYDWTLGLNWLLNPNTKIQFNYMLLRRDGQQNVAEGWINGLGTRVAVDF
jgi:phosphate-selective porin OprO/OprP